MKQGTLFDSEAATEPAPAAAARKPQRPLPEPLDDTAIRRPKLPHPLRDVTAGELERELAAWHRGELTPDELMRLTRGATYPLENAELVQVLEFMVRLLRASP